MTIVLILLLCWLGVLLARHLYYLRRLQAWLIEPQKRDLPRGSGMWEGVFSRLSRQYRQQTLAQKKLENSLDRFIQAGEAMPDGVMVLDEEGKIEWLNPMACAHFALNREQDCGALLVNLLRQPNFLRYWREEQFSQPCELKINREGETLILSIQLVPFDSTRKLLLSQDRTQLSRVQMVHQDFVANVSHELRTPLTVVGGFLETLSDSPDLPPETLRHFLALMQAQTRRMEHLIKDLLTLSSLEGKPSFAAQEPIDMRQLLQYLLTEAQALSQNRHEIVLKNQDDATVLGEWTEFHSALSNLVSNAVRYTPEGGRIEMAWRVLREHSCWRGEFSVRDTGIGIAREHLPRLTERFYRVDRGRSRDTGGTGLGLAIVRQVLARHDARLEIESELGEGSVFYVRLPASRVLLSEAGA